MMCIQAVSITQYVAVGVGWVPMTGICCLWVVDFYLLRLLPLYSNWWLNQTQSGKVTADFFAFLAERLLCHFPGCSTEIRIQKKKRKKTQLLKETGKVYSHKSCGYISEQGASFIPLKKSSSLFFDAKSILCVLSGECGVSSAPLCHRLMERRAICLSEQPSIRVLRSYQCVSPANGKLAGTLPPLLLKWITSPNSRSCWADLSPSSFFYLSPCSACSMSSLKLPANSSTTHK